MKISDKGIDFISEFEGLYLRAYDDLNPSTILKANTKIKGTLTIGIGHIGRVNGKPIAWNTEITKAQAKQLLIEDLEEKTSIINAKIKRTIDQNMFDALISYIFNAGQNNSHAIRCMTYINGGLYDKAGLELKNGAQTSKGVVLEGLKRRRNAEYKLFMEGVNKLTKVSAKCSDMPTIQLNSIGTAVKLVQVLLNLNADGKFGSGTKEKVIEFQKSKNLTSDGIVGGKTWTELFKLI